MRKLLSLTVAIILFSKVAHAAIDPCLPPCALPCNITNYGGVVVAVQEVGQRAAQTGYEIRRQTHYERQQIKAIAREARTGLKAITEGIKKLKKMLGDLMSDKFSVFSDDNGKSLEKPITQDVDIPANASTLERVKRNTDKKYYEIETKAGVENEYAFQQRRTYIRQQATMKYIARVMMLKNKYGEIVKIVNKIEKDVDQSSASASSQGNLEGSENKRILLKTTAELKTAWEQLLLIQKQIEAARLEYAANIGLSNMKPVKTIPTVNTK